MTDHATETAGSVESMELSGTGRPRPRRRWLWRVAGGTVALLMVSAAGLTWAFSQRYAMHSEMNVPIREKESFEYAEDPAPRSTLFGRYQGRQLKLEQRDEKHFDFVLEPEAAHVSRIVFRNIDVSLMTPGLPEWARHDAGVARIALVDREWNRQQVQFAADSRWIEVSGGDGFEQEHLMTASLAKNCLNAGLWEVLLFIKEDGQKKMYYQGWFTFPLGQYKRLWEANTGLSYWQDLNWYQLEHWLDPAGTEVDLNVLRTIRSEQSISTDFNPRERVLVRGEQLRKHRTTQGVNLVTWEDVIRGEGVSFASFIPPGCYDVDTPWQNEYWRLSELKSTTLRDVDCPTGEKNLQELELVFHDPQGQPNRLIIGGVNLAGLPQLSTDDYPKGFYMPMGIGVPPFYQSYEELLANPPTSSPYYSFILDGKGEWIDHHKAAIDGPVMHRDEHDPGLVHLYLLSYERHTLVAHFEIRLPGQEQKPGESSGDRPPEEIAAPSKEHTAPGKRLQ